MTRLVAAALLLTLAAAPTFACEWQKSVSTDMQKRVAASHPSENHAVPAPNTTVNRKPS